MQVNEINELFSSLQKSLATSSTSSEMLLLQPIVKYQFGSKIFNKEMDGYHLILGNKIIMRNHVILNFFYEIWTYTKIYIIMG